MRGNIVVDLGALGGVFGALTGAAVGALAITIGHEGAPSRVQLREGDLVSGWRVVRIIAATGPTGPVHLVHRKGQWGVMKSIHRDDAVLGHRASVLIHETASARRVDSRYVARLVDGGEVGDRCFVVYHFAGDIDLERAISSGRRPGAQGAVADQRLWRLALTTAMGVRDIHSRQLVHQDLTPANICDRDDFGLILDLGMARVDNALLTTSSRKRLALEYSPPERQRVDYRAHPSSDVYQWAACMLSAATGRRPYGGAQEEALVRAIASSPPDTASVPTWLRRLLDAALAAKPRKRPSADELVARLTAIGAERRWATLTPGNAHPPAAWRRHPAPEIRAGVGGGLAVVVVLAALALVFRQPEPETQTEAPIATGVTVADEPSSTTGSSTTETTTEPTTTSTTTSTTTTTTSPLVDDAGWPTDTDEAPPAVQALFGVELTEGLDPPDWTSCVDDYCIAGRSQDIYVYEGAQRLGFDTLDEGQRPFDLLIEIGFTEDQARALLDP